MWIHLDLASLQGHWLSLGASGQLVFIKPTKDKAHDRLQQPARPRNKSCWEDFPSLSSEKRHTHISQGWNFRFIKDTQKKRDLRKRFLENGSRPPWEKLQTSPYKRGHFQEELLRGKLLVFWGVVWACVIRFLYGPFSKKGVAELQFSRNSDVSKIYLKQDRSTYLSINLSNG